MTDERDDKIVNIQHGRMNQWYINMVDCIQELPPDERAEFDQWDRSRAEGVATSDWPRFAKYLPTRPWDVVH